MKLSIIVTVYNEVQTVKEAIDNVRSLNIEKEIMDKIGMKAEDLK